MEKAKLFRRLLKQKKQIVICGAHDALSAKLIEEAGFDGVWASSFGISASTKCMPDANVLTMTEALEAAKGMNEAISIPLIADCDNGYGNAHNVIRMVREYERAGIAGISIEDNPFPKKCSLYPGERRELVNTEEMAGRIHAAKSTQRNPDFFVIARTEALIAGLGMEEALTRAHAYEDAGADAILIHSRQSTPHEIKEFGARWDGKIPLVAVPTKYPSVTWKDLGKMGVSITIFANQAMRASVDAMKSTLAEIKRDGSVASVEKKIVPLSEIFRLVGQPDLELNEERFVKSFRKAPAAIIVAAGFEKNFWPLNADRPKAMLEIKGKTILDRQTELLQRGGVDKISVVAGYKAEMMRGIAGIKTYRNPNYRQTGMLSSLWCAKPELADKFLFLYGDVLFEDYVLDRLLKSKGDISLVVQRRGRGGDEGARPKPQRDWVIESRDTPETGKITQIGHHIPAAKATGEFIGLAMFSKRGADLLRETYEKHAKKNGYHRFHNAPNMAHAQFTDMMQELIDRGASVNAVPIRDGWMDIDTFEDFQSAWREVSV